MAEQFNYTDFINGLKGEGENKTNLDKTPFTVGDLKKNNQFDFRQMDSPSQVGHSYVDKNYYDQNKAYRDFSKKVDDYSFKNSFDKAMNKDIGSNIESSKAVNSTIKNSKGNVNTLIPDVMSKVSDNVDNTIESITSYFQNKIDDISMNDINNYAKISDALNQKAGLDSQLETDLLKAWSVNKEMEYALEGLEIEKDSMYDSQFFQTISLAVNTVSTIVGAIALFL